MASELQTGSMGKNSIRGQKCSERRARMKSDRILVRLTRKEFNTLPVLTKRRCMALQADNLVIYSKRKELTLALDLLAVALADHNHTWSLKERRAYQRAVRALN